jgi:hypothetical protein
MSKSRKSTKKNSRTRRKRGGASRLPPLKVKTCENLNSQLSRYREYITILKSDDARTWQGMMKTVKELEVDRNNAHSRNRPEIRGKIEVATAEAEAFYNKSKLSNLDLNLFRMKEDVGYGIAKYNDKIRYIIEKTDWIDQGCTDTVEGGRKRTRRKKRRRRRKSTKKKRRRRRR